MEIIDRLNSAIEKARESLREALDKNTIETVRIEFFGRKGLFQELSKEMKNVDSSERPILGKAFNVAKNELRAFMDAATDKIESNSKSNDREAFDVTLPGRRWRFGKKHPISMVVDDCVAIFRRLGFIVADGPEIETVYNNFDALNTPMNHPSRDVQDTFYFGDGRLLRTQTSPVQIRTMENQGAPVRIIAPGRCFRRDTPDATHSMNFHQIEGLYIDKNVSLSDLKSVLLHFAHELFGKGVKIRLRPHFFPFTEPSVECDFSCILCEGKGCRVCKQSGWLEIAGAGMVDPAVLTGVGYDPLELSGYAFGMGIERIAMVRYRINDIRLLYENDLAFLHQF